MKVFLLVQLAVFA